MDKIKRKETKYIIIHSSETTPSQNLNSKDLNKLHRQKGFLNVKYHFIITRDGEVEKGRGKRGRQKNKDGQKIKGR